MANMNDVAKLAGVSRGTVSNYINGVKINEKSAERIKEAIATLNYVPNQAARSLKKNYSDTVAFILPTIWTPFFAELTYFIQIELQKYGLKLLLCNSQNDFSKELEYVQMAKEEKVKGIITISYSDIDPYLTSNIPIVSIERYFNQQVPFVTSDNFIGARTAAYELHRRGSERLLLIMRRLPKNMGIFERMNGFIDYSKHAKIPFDIHEDIGDSAGFSQRLDTYLSEIYKDSIPYDGIFTMTDRYAEYVLHSFSKLQWQIPDDLQLIGFDGAKSYQSQPLLISTIRQNVSEIARISVDEVVHFDKDKAPQNLHFLPVKFLQLTTTRELPID